MCPIQYCSELNSRPQFRKSGNERKSWSFKSSRKLEDSKQLVTSRLQQFDLAAERQTPGRAVPVPAWGLQERDAVITRFLEFRPTNEQGSRPRRRTLGPQLMVRSLEFRSCHYSRESTDVQMIPGNSVAPSTVRSSSGCKHWSVGSRCLMLHATATHALNGMKISIFAHMQRASQVLCRSLCADDGQ
jgi:hypothetical protein